MERKTEYTGFKYNRILQIYSKLINGEVINKTQEAQRFGVHQKSIQRDLDDLRAFFRDQADEGGMQKELVYDYERNGYWLLSKDMPVLTDSEIFAVCKILLESRAFRKEDISQILDKMMICCTSRKSQLAVRDLISNELEHYVEPHHGKAFIESLWSIGLAVKEQKIMRIQYQKQNGAVVERTVKPVGVLFSEFYFYLCAFIDEIDREAEFANKDDIFPTIYRIDRIQSFTIEDRHFAVPYAQRFETGEFRKRVQFMYGGRMRRVKFKYTGPNIESVLDRLPTAAIIRQDEDGYVITAEVFGDGIDMWMRSQGEWIEVTGSQ